MDYNRIFVSGYAKLPKGITAEELYKVIGIGLVVYKSTGEIIEADCTLATDTGKRFIIELLKGKNINQVDRIIEEIKTRYFGHAKKALISALKMCHEKFEVAISGDYSADT